MILRLSRKLELPAAAFSVFAPGLEPQRVHHLASLYIASFFPSQLSKFRHAPSTVVGAHSIRLGVLTSCKNGNVTLRCRRRIVKLPPFTFPYLLPRNSAALRGDLRHTLVSSFFEGLDSRSRGIVSIAKMNVGSGDTIPYTVPHFFFWIIGIISIFMVWLSRKKKNI
jgi:hypothetical protein